jgi:hypothetical protein
LFAAEQEAVAAELEVSQFAARAVSDMDNAVMRIRQEAAKRVASAERERDRAKEESRVAVAEVKRKKAAIEEMLRQIKLDAVSISQSPHSASLIAHTRLTLYFLSPSSRSKSHRFPCAWRRSATRGMLIVLMSRPMAVESLLLLRE